MTVHFVLQPNGSVFKPLYLNIIVFNLFFLFLWDLRTMLWFDKEFIRFVRPLWSLCCWIMTSLIAVGDTFVFASFYHLFLFIHFFIVLYFIEYFSCISIFNISLLPIYMFVCSFCHFCLILVSWISFSLWANILFSFICKKKIIHSLKVRIDISYMTSSIFYCIDIWIFF